MANIENIANLLAHILPSMNYRFRPGIYVMPLAECSISDVRDNLIFD